MRRARLQNIVPQRGVFRFSICYGDAAVAHPPLDDLRHAGTRGCESREEEVVAEIELGAAVGIC